MEADNGCVALDESCGAHVGELRLGDPSVIGFLNTLFQETAAPLCTTADRKHATVSFTTSCARFTAGTETDFSALKLRQCMSSESSETHEMQCVSDWLKVFNKSELYEVAC